MLAAASFVGISANAAEPQLQMAKRTQAAQSLKLMDQEVSAQLLPTYRNSQAGQSQFVQGRKALKKRSAYYAPNAAAAAAAPEFMAQVVATDADDFQCGIYKLSSTGEITPYYLNPYMGGSYGAALDEIQHTYRTNTLTMVWGYIHQAYSSFYSVNEDGEFDFITNWSNLDEEGNLNWSYFANAMVCDQETGKIYGNFVDARLSKIYVGEMPIIEAHQSEMIIPQSEGGSYLLSPWYACGIYDDAKNKTKLLYGLNMKGQLMCVDIKEGSKTFGEQTIIGDTGLSSEYLTCGVIYDDTFYFATSNYGDCALYAITLDDATVTKLYDFEGFIEFSNLFVLPPQAEEKAPAAPENGIMSFPKAALTGDITFSMPTTLYDGTKATGQCDYNVYVYLGGEEDSNLVMTRKGEASYNSTLVTETFNLTQPGLYTFVVRAENSVGESPKLKIRGWIGPDSPQVPQNVKLVYDYSKKQFAVSWDAVKAGQHEANGSYFNPADVKYNVTLSPTMASANAQNLAVTSYKTTFAAPTELTAYYYTVEVVYNGVATGVEGRSNIWLLGSEDVPFDVTFDSTASTDEVFLFDADNDGFTWYIGESEEVNNHETCLIVRYNDEDLSEPKDEWIVTPGLRLEKGKYYEYSVDAAVAAYYWWEDFEVKCGTDPNPDKLAEADDVIASLSFNDVSFTPFSGSFTCPEDGVYYFGFHAKSEADSGRLYVRNIKVSTPLDINAPKAVTDLAAIPDENGGASALLSFNLPTETINGDAIKSVSYVDIYRNGTYAGRVTKGLNAGNFVKYIDDSADLDAYNTYKVVPVIEVTNEDGTSSALEGISSEITIYVGTEDVVPGAVTDIVLEEDGNTGKVHISWTAPVLNEEGDPLPAHVCKYEVLDADVELDENGDVVPGTGSVAQDTNYDTEWTANLGEDAQGFVQFFVRAYIQHPDGSRTYGPTTGSTFIFVGKPYDYPMVETVTNGQLKYELYGENWYVLDASKEYGITMTGVDDDYYITSFANRGTLTLYTGKVFIPADAKNPYLSYYWFMFEENNGNQISSEIKPVGGTWEKGSTVVAGEGTMGWNRVLVDLNKYKGQTIQVQFKTRKMGVPMDMIDRIAIEDFYPNNLNGEFTSAPESVNPNSAFTITAGFFNNGNEEVAPGACTIALYRNGEKVQTQTCENAIAAGTVATFQFEETLSVVDEAVEYYAVAEWAADEDLANNYTPVKKVDVIQYAFPTTELSGDLNELGQPELSWLSAEYNTGSSQLSDGFENYKPWISVGDQDGDWETIDADQTNVAGLTYWPVLNLPNDFFVVDVNETDLNGYAHSGNKVLVSSGDYNGERGRDDWLISKELKTDGLYDLTFWARGFNSSYVESFQVLVSDKTNAKEDFRPLLYVPQAPMTWTEFRLMLPEGTKYFAINCISDLSGSLFFIDDIKLEGLKMNLVGYNVYRNGLRLNENVVSELAYTDEQAPQEECKYEVSVVWDLGESAPSNVVSLQVTQGGIGSIESAIANVAVDGRNIIISEAEGQQVAIYNADGKIVYRAGGAAKSVVAVEPAVYLVKVGAKTARVIVR